MPKRGYQVHNEEDSLVQRARKRDAEAFGELYELYYDRIYRFAAFRVRNLTEAEDIAEQVFLKAWEAIGSYDMRGLPFAAWLFRIARNTTIDLVRHQARRQIVPLPEGFSSISQPDPVEFLETKLSREELIGAMRKLTDAQRQVIALRFGGELSLLETARVMGKTEGAIKALQHDGIASLRRHMAGQK